MRQRFATFRYKKNYSVFDRDRIDIVIRDESMTLCSNLEEMLNTEIIDTSELGEIAKLYLKKNPPFHKWPQ